MKTITKIGCALIGWNANLLSECGEASHAKFNKLVTAILIMVMLWGTIGYLLAARYVGIESIPGRMGVAFAFMLAVLGIERVIVLHDRSACGNGCVHGSCRLVYFRPNDV